MPRGCSWALNTPSPRCARLGAAPSSTSPPSRGSSEDKPPPTVLLRRRCVFSPRRRPCNTPGKAYVLHHAAWQLVTGNGQLQHGTPSGCQTYRRIYTLLGAGKLVMGEPGGKNHHGFPPEVVHAPRRKPLPLGGSSTAGGCLDQKPGARFVLPLRQWEAPPTIPPSITAGYENCTCKKFSAPWFSSVR